MLDMIVDGENGLVIAPDDVAALASALERLLQRGDLRQQLGESAEVFARHNFDIHVRKLAFLDLLNNLARARV
jgi:glycosyltransferase involved in cell wall biosynthesis